MTIFKFRITWIQTNMEFTSQDDSRITGHDRMECEINIIATDEELARLAFTRHWKFYSWLEYEIHELISSEPVWTIVPSIGFTSGGDVMNTKVLRKID